MYKRQPKDCLLSLFYLPYRIKKRPNNTCSYRVANRQISVHGIKIQAVYSVTTFFTCFPFRIIYTPLRNAFTSASLA